LESATVRRSPPLPAPIQVGLVGLLVALAAVAWVITDDRMGGMDAGPGTDPGTLGFFVGIWVVMMAAMMFPSIAPMVVMHARVLAGRRRDRRLVSVPPSVLFVAGYLLAWAAAGVAAYAVYQLGEAATGDLFSWDRGGQYLAGGIVLVAAAYQLTPLKNRCLEQCRSPFSLVTDDWRSGNTGSLEMGVVHGAWCIGCCWALMAALFALGVMSLAWMAFIAALIAAEKLLPWRAFTRRAVAVVLVVVGIALAFTPASVPGLILPGSPEAMRAMESMEGGSMGEMGNGDMEMGKDSMDKGAMQKDSMGKGSMRDGSMGNPAMRDDSMR
jgi:predicted metal-binding membrane protein